jgi:tripartite-type tricarboxylate transporter receptor subunit TctC
MLLRFGASWIAATFALLAPAQTYPTRPVRLIVSVAPGGNLDMMGRATAQALTEGLGRQVIVENRPGANSTIGADHVARSAPDGYTLLMVAATLLIGPRMMSNPPFDPIRDFTGVSQIATLPQMLVVHPSLPLRSTKDLIAFAQARPGELNYATSGNGSGSHMAMELFMRQANVRLTRIPYNGDGPALVNLLGGQVPVKFDNLSTSIGHVRAGRLRALGVTTPKRTDLLLEVPAISETLPGFEASIFNGMVAPSATPKDVLARLHGEILKFVQSAANRTRFAQLGVELQASPSPEHFTAVLRSEYARFSKIIEEAGITQ